MRVRVCVLYTFSTMRLGLGLYIYKFLLGVAALQWGVRLFVDTCMIECSLNVHMTSTIVTTMTTTHCVFCDYVHTLHRSIERRGWYEVRFLVR